LRSAWEEVLWLRHYFEIFCQFRDIADQSESDEEHSQFWDFVRWAFIGELIHRVDRICEPQWRNRKKRVLSLGAFLSDLRPHSRSSGTEEGRESEVGSLSLEKRKFDVRSASGKVEVRDDDL
jgi:hypothetical protein